MAMVRPIKINCDGIFDSEISMGRTFLFLSLFLPHFRSRSTRSVPFSAIRALFLSVLRLPSSVHAMLAPPTHTQRSPNDRLFGSLPMPDKTRGVCVCVLAQVNFFCAVYLVRVCAIFSLFFFFLYGW